ncbi:MAG: YbbR-like domain-containing protein [candidate division Zixibacteria bacterium]|nr:YbbR-like domain-containing protein [candidate division Zixibacteria bacterium]
MISLLDNLSIKLVALALGLLLWFHVATEKTYHHTLQLPVTDIMLGKGLTLARIPPDSLEVVVSATGKQLLRRKWRERGLKINAVQLSAGRHNVDLTPVNTSLISASEFVTLEKVVIPVSTEFYVDRRAETMISVTPDIVALPGEGFAVAGISPPEPAQVKLTGPRSLIDGFSTVFTDRKELDGLRNNLTISLPLTQPRGYGIRLEPDSVTLSVEVVPVRTRVFDNIPIVLYNVPPASTVSTSPNELTVILTGPPDDIDSLNATVLAASADYTRVDSQGRVAVNIYCPAKFRVKNSSVDSVTIVVH